MDAMRLLIGWREWISLPELGLIAIKAKVDTGARTSALHAFDISTYEDRGLLKIKFKIHPLTGRKDISVTCRAIVVDRRYVMDSGGHREKRYVIQTPIQIGGLQYPIEITLSNRESMAHRMLIGRSAMNPLMIDPSHAFLLGRPTGVAKAYKAAKAARIAQKKAGKAVRVKKKAKVGRSS